MAHTVTVQNLDTEYDPKPGIKYELGPDLVCTMPEPTLDHLRKVNKAQEDHDGEPLVDQLAIIVEEKAAFSEYDKSKLYLRTCRRMGADFLAL
ncbi:MAG: hypothetical protein AAGJ10_20580 [Bacteroidota bacterium]